MLRDKLEYVADDIAKRVLFLLSERGVYDPNDPEYTFVGASLEIALRDTIQDELRFV